MDKLMRIDSPGRRAAEAIAEKLKAAGYTAYLAGGCVRDELTGKTPKDYDIATDALPDMVKRLFPGARYVGESFGVVLVKMNQDFIEVATFRKEWGYEDGRRPSGVEFTDAEEDASRRDFTINGIFADAQTGEVIDFVGGRDDLKHGVIRAIGDPQHRFGEDYLRMLRAVRFVARLGFEIEQDTAAAIRAYAGKLYDISRERIGMEVLAMLGHSSRAAAMDSMQHLLLDGPVLDEPHDHAALNIAQSLDDHASAMTALAAWMMDRHGPSSLDGLNAFVDETAPATMRRWRKALCLSNDDRDELRSIMTLLPAATNWQALEVAGRKRLLAAPHAEQARHLLRALAATYDVANTISAIDQDAPALLAEGVAPEPFVTGDDLIALGMSPGPAFKTLLDDLYDRQLDGRLTNRDQAMLHLRENYHE